MSTKENTGNVGNLLLINPFQKFFGDHRELKDDNSMINPSNTLSVFPKKF